MTETTRSPYLNPGDADYADAGAAWNLVHRQHPALVTAPRSVEEVVDAVRYAEKCGLKVAIQTTGHGVCALSDEQAMLLSLRSLREFSVDPHRAEATVRGGVQWIDMLDASQDHGLAPLLGSTPHVGAVGYSLGGGIGWLARHHGLAVDRIRSLTVVLPGGAIVTASAESEPDLFWALCGTGSGSLGVVVEMTTGLVPVSDVYAGNLLYPVDAAGDVFGFWREWVREVGTEMTSALVIMAFPDLEDVPPPLRGQTFTIVRGCYCGDPAEGQALLDQIRAWRQPVVDLFGPLPFREMAVISQDPVDPVPAALSGRWIADADGSILGAMVAFVRAGGLFAELRHSGGAIRTPNPSACFAARDAEFVLAAVAITPTPELQAAAYARIDQLMAATKEHHAALPGYLNFVDLDERRRMLGYAFDSETRQRLAAIKRAVDPGDLFGYGLVLTQ